MAQPLGSEARAGLKLISPTAIYVILLLAVPLATVLIYSVLTGGRGNVSLPITIENYAELWTKAQYGYIMLKSLLVALTVTLPLPMANEGVTDHRPLAPTVAVITSPVPGMVTVITSPSAPVPVMLGVSSLVTRSLLAPVLLLSSRRPVKLGARVSTA